MAELPEHVCSIQHLQMDIGNGEPGINRRVPPTVGPTTAPRGYPRWGNMALPTSTTPGEQLVRSPTHIPRARTGTRSLKLDAKRGSRVLQGAADQSTSGPGKSQQEQERQPLVASGRHIMKKSSVWSVGFYWRTAFPFDGQPFLAQELGCYEFTER